MNRVRLILAGWGLLFAASPGTLWPNGSLLLAVLGVGVVGSALVRPLGTHPKRALVMEWAAGGVGATCALWWVYYVAPPALLIMAAVLGIYQLVAGWLIRRLRRRFSLGVAVALGWLGAESLRCVLLPPLGLGWLLLGHHASHHFWLAGSARVWGVEGLSLVVAALGGCLAELIVESRLSRSTLGLAGGSLALGLLLASLTGVGELVPGPRAMLVQPGLSQEEKSQGEFLSSMQQRSLAALGEARARGLAEVDFVAWGESMLPLSIAEPGVQAALAAGANLPGWQPQLNVDDPALWLEAEGHYLRRPFLERLPPGTTLLTGVEVHDVQAGSIQRYVGTALFGAEGRLGPVAKKRRLVPGGETMLGLERFAFVREGVFDAIGYIPDFQPGTETGVLELPTRAGRSYRIAAMACFDNAFAEPAVEALLAGPVDMLLVTSNEAWYQGAAEMDQMIAFSRILAICTGRSFLRVTNSGVSLLLGPDGRELDRLWVAGRDRSVAGELIVTIPVPAEQDAAAPPYVHLRGILRLVLGLFLLAALWFCRRAKTPRV